MHIKLLDADFLINLIRTLSLIEDYEDITFIYGKFDSNRHFKLVSTNKVQDEVRIKIKSNDGHHKFFCQRDTQANRIRNNIFRNYIEIHNVRDNDLTFLATTNLQNIGEKSLVHLLHTRYLNTRNNSINIVSNNEKDVLHNLKKLKAKDPRNMGSIDLNSIIQSNYEFYNELFNYFRLDSRFKMYYYFVSNIDARVVDINKIKNILPPRSII